MIHITSNSNTETNNRQEVSDTDLQEPVTVTAIRNGQMVSVSWNDLTEAEKRTAYVVMFSPCNYE